MMYKSDSKYNKVGELLMELTTGKVVCNLRHMEINGIDYLVDVTKENRHLRRNTAELHCDVSQYNHFVTSPTKFSNKCFQTDNSIGWIHFNIYLNNDNTLDIDNFPTSDFTLSYWFYIDRYNERAATLKIGPAGIGVDGNGTKLILNYGDKFNNTFVRTSISTISGWNHAARVSKNNIQYAFLNGTLIKTLEYATCLSNQITFSTYMCKTTYDDIVFIKDEALWTSNFIPPTDYLINDDILTPQEVKDDGLWSCLYNRGFDPSRENNILKVY